MSGNGRKKISENLTKRIIGIAYWAVNVSYDEPIKFRIEKNYAACERKMLLTYILKRHTAVLSIDITKFLKLKSHASVNAYTKKVCDLKDVYKDFSIRIGDIEENFKNGLLAAGLNKYYI